MYKVLSTYFVGFNGKSGMNPTPRDWLLQPQDKKENTKDHTRWEIMPWTWRRVVTFTVGKGEKKEGKKNKSRAGI